RLQAPRRELVRRAEVRGAAAREPLRGRLEHDPHRGRDAPELGEIPSGHDPRVQMREEPGLVEHRAGRAGEVLERRLAAERGELLARDAVAELGLVAEGEERLVTADRGAGTRDLQDLVEREIGALAPPWRPREG